LPKAPSPEFLKVGGAKRDIVLPSYVIPIAVGVLVVVSVIALPKFLSRGVEPSSPASKTTKARAVTSGTEEQPSSGDVSRSAKSNSSSSSRDALKNSAAAAAAKEIPKPPAASPSPAALRTETKPAADSPANSASPSGSAPGRGEVLDQIMPDVPDKALSTITGKVRVAVRAHVDPAGNVSDAEFEDPGPSEYFAKAALKAVRRWEFTSPEVGGHSVPSEWLVRFEFAPDGVKAFPQQITP
jgi:TonB family protein